MKRICRELQERLAEQGAEGLREDVAAQRHLEECADCFGVLEGLARLDAVLGDLTPSDAPEAVVSDLLERVRSEGSAPVREPIRRGGVPRPVLWGLASAAALVIGVSVLTPPLMRARVAPSRAAVVLESGPIDRSDATPPTTVVPEPGQLKKESIPETSENQFHKKNVENEKNGALTKEQIDNLRALGYVQSSLDRATAPASDAEDKLADKTLEVAGDDVQRSLHAGGKIDAPGLIRRVEPVYPEAARAAGVEGVVILEVRIAASGKVEKARVLRSVPLLDAAALEAVRQWVYAPTVVNGQAVPMTRKVALSFRLPEPGKSPGSSENQATDPARAFLEERGAVDGVPFQPANGYWANTYVPGDPALRLLQARLAAWDRSTLALPAGTRPRLHDAAVQPSQPFDAPRDAALAVDVHADRRGLLGPGRMLVQVGLKGAERAGGRRPAMSVALVLDLRGEVPMDTASGMRALAGALSRAREAGDRFSLVVVGRPGGVAVAAAEFKNGPLAVAMDRLFARRSSSGEGLRLADALAIAYREVSRCDDPEAPLGASAVLLVTGQALDESGTLADLAHQGAVAGIPLSVIVAGGGASLDEIDRLVLAGQGHRGVLEAPADAARVVDAELHAAGNAVARAVRLQVRLSPGVRLVEVVGSRRLDETQAERVRQAERSIDLDLSRKLGIDSDRGLDEDGIQIVIPSFQARDAHVILLDVVAPGPGPIADVAIRYKDLLFLRNGVARASLTLSRDTAVQGPLERNVVANLLAFRVSRALACGGDALAAGDVAGALAPIEQARALLSGLGGLVPRLAGDPALLRDAEMLNEYAVLLTGGALRASERPPGGRLAPLCGPAQAAAAPRSPRRRRSLNEDS